MNILEQINKFVTTALQNNNKVTLDGQEINDIECGSIEHINDICQRIQFTVTFTETVHVPWPIQLKKGEHIYHLDIDTRSLEITDNRFYMHTIPLPDKMPHKHQTIRISEPSDRMYMRVCMFSFCIDIYQF